MFTGIITTTGTFHSVDKKTANVLEISANLPLNVKIGDSIAVNGICLTVIAMGSQNYRFNVSQETLALSNLLDLSLGKSVNIELPLRLQDFLGGHLVSGHIDGTARIRSIRIQPDSTTMGFTYQNLEWNRYLISKGSITVNGVSLTVASHRSGFFTVIVIPHTIENTNLKALRIGDRVNIELDLIGKYLYNIQTNKR
jgi:riboflavin synthase